MYHNEPRYQRSADSLDISPLSGVGAYARRSLILRCTPPSIRQSNVSVAGRRQEHPLLSRLWANEPYFGRVQIVNNPRAFIFPFRCWFRYVLRTGSGKVFMLRLRIRDRSILELPVFYLGACFEFQKRRERQRWCEAKREIFLSKTLRRFQ